MTDYTAPGQAPTVGWSNQYPRIMQSTFDQSFKTIITGGWHNEDTGNVEAPTGFVSLVSIEDEDLRREGGSLWDAIFNENDYTRSLPVPPAGFYLTQEDNRGIIWVWACPTLQFAQSAFHAIEQQYVAWEEEEGD